MRITAPAYRLSDAVSIASAIKRGGSSPCLAHLATTGDAVSITCTENTVGTIATSVPATIHEPGEIAVSVSRLAALLSSFPADAILDIEATAGAVNIVSGKSRLRLPAVSAEDSLPAIVIEKEIGRVEISTADVQELLEPLAVADRARLCLAGVFWHSVGDRLVAVSTNGIRLIRTSVAASTFSEDRRLIVPNDVGVVVRRLLQKADASYVTLRRSPGLIAFEVAPFCFTARLIDSTFPAYESVIPAPTNNLVRCNRLGLLAALCRLSAAAPSHDTALVALRWENGRHLDLQLARNPVDGADVVSAEAHGSAEVALSLPQLVALLKELVSDHVQLETVSEQPVVIRGAGDKLALIVRSRWNFAEASIRDRPAGNTIRCQEHAPGALS
jgi:DNA polymerase-3 subunit beta